MPAPNSSVVPPSAYVSEEPSDSGEQGRVRKKGVFDLLNANFCRLMVILGLCRLFMVLYKPYFSQFLPSDSGGQKEGGGFGNGSSPWVLELFIGVQIAI